MVFKGSYRLSYTIDGKSEELAVDVDVKEVGEILKPRQCLYYGVAQVNSVKYDKVDLMGCVNAVFAAGDIGKELKTEIISKAKNDGKKFKLIKEVVK